MSNDNKPRIHRGPGGPARIAPIAESEMGPDEFAVFDYVRDVTGFPKDTPVHPFFLTMGHSPGFMKAFTRLGMEAIQQSAIPRRERELVILRTAWLCDAPFQWCEHIANARACGIGDDDIARIKIGSVAPQWDARDRALLRAVEDLDEDNAIGDETWEALAAHFDDRQLLELPIVVGHYRMTAYLQNSLRIPPERDMHGNELES
jgi:alkylhydroperoxidase family enzyme